MDAQPPPIPSAGQIPLPPLIGAKHCKNCGFVGAPALPGLGWVELLLWLCYLLPGLIYSLWRRGSGRHVCPTCHAPYMIPLSPAHVGGYVAPQHIQSASVQPDGATLPQMRPKTFPTWAVVLLVLAIFALINDGWGPLSDIAAIVRALPRAVRQQTPANEPTFTPAEKEKQRRDIQELIRKTHEGH